MFAEFAKSKKKERRKEGSINKFRKKGGFGKVEVSIKPGKGIECYSCERP